MDGRKGGDGKKDRGVCVCVSANRYNSQSAEPIPPIKVHLDQVVTGFSGSEGRLVWPDMERGGGGHGGRLEWLGWASPPPPLMVVMMMVAVAAPLLDVVGEPAEAFAVALPLQHAAHEHLQRSCVQLLHGNGALRSKRKHQNMHQPR